jgi:carbon storage regulator
MLVLSRKSGEIIRIGDSISIEVVAVHGDRVRLGITAPSDVAVHRQEIYEAIERQKLEKLQRDPDFDD